jgi:coenzyme F420-dependent glucose-6-phosphate dehydrogenase
MAMICYHASHEQFAPSHLLKLVILTEKAGFKGIHSSDHFHPWSVRQGQSGFTFSWIAAAMQATTLPFSMVCAPGQRYHPAIAAQAIATLAEMFPGRINIELGSGEAINEMITGQGWPAKHIRNERLLECATIIRKLLNGENVHHNGHVTVEMAKLYTRPTQLPLLLCAAISRETSQWAATWADGLLTTADNDITTLTEKINAFRNNGGNDKPVYLQFAFSYARSKQDAIDGAYDQWRSNILPREKLADLHTVEEFDEAGGHVTPGDVTAVMPVITDMKILKERIQFFEQTGADRIILHNINRLQEEFIEDYAQIAK